MAIEIVDFPIKNGDFPVRYSGFSHLKWWFSIVFCMFPRGFHGQAINFIRSNRALTPDRPFFIYFAPGGTHGPHHVHKTPGPRKKGTGGRSTPGCRNPKRLHWESTVEVGDHWGRCEWCLSFSFVFITGHFPRWASCRGSPRSPRCGVCERELGRRLPKKSNVCSKRERNNPRERYPPVILQFATLKMAIEMMLI